MFPILPFHFRVKFEWLVAADGRPIIDGQSWAAGLHCNVAKLQCGKIAVWENCSVALGVPTVAPAHCNTEIHARPVFHRWCSTGPIHSENLHKPQNLPKTLDLSPSYLEPYRWPMRISTKLIDAKWADGGIGGRQFMLLRLLFRRETIVLGGVTAAFVVPMFRSGELSVGKIAHWAANGIAASESADATNERFDDFGIWPQVSARALPKNPGLSSGENGNFPQSPAAGDGSAQTGTLAKFLNSIFETQTLPVSQDPTTIGIPQTTGPLGHRPTLISGGTPPTTAIPSIKSAIENSAATPDRLSWIPVNDLREVIRFDVSPYWVQQRWQPATRLDLDQDGYYGFRVPFTSDQRVGNLTGALTFFFDAKAVVQRIQFQGMVQDATVIEGLLRQYFRFEPVPDRPNLWAPVHRGTARGMLRFSDPLPNESDATPSLREVAFEVNSTQGNYKLSEAYRQIAVQ